MTLFENLIWQHTNGDKYKIVGEAIIEETLEPAIVYQRVGAEPLIWVRPAKVFFERFSPVFPPKSGTPETTITCLDAKDVSIKVGDTVVIADEYRTTPRNQNVAGLKVVELKVDNLIIALDTSEDSWVLRGKEVVVTAEAATAAKDEIECLDHNGRSLKVGDTVFHYLDLSKANGRRVWYEVEKLQAHGHIRLKGEVHPALASKYVRVHVA